MKPGKALPAAFLALVLAGGGAALATAQGAQAGDDAISAHPRMEHGESREGHGREHGQRGHFGHRGHGGFGGGEMLRTIFAQVDADDDGSVTQAEIDAFRAARIEQADASGDGALSIEEFDTLYREFTRFRMVDAFQHLDADGDGVIDSAEMDSRVGGIVERMDRDGDGALTLRDRRG